MRASAPDARVLLMSGYTDGVLVEDFALKDDIAFIQKPFSSEGIAWKLRAVLDAPLPPES